MAQAPASESHRLKIENCGTGKSLPELLRHPKILLGIAALVAVTIFISELVMNFLLGTFPNINPLLEAIIDSAVLILLLTPTLFALHLRSIAKAAPSGALVPGQRIPSQRLGISVLSLPNNLRSRQHVLAMVLLLGVIIFCGELVVMFLFMAFPVESPLLEAFIDATVLVTLVSPALVSLFYLPVRRRVEALSASAHEIRALTQRLMDVSEEEQRRLALDLHDEFGQTLSAMKLEVDTLCSSGAETSSNFLGSCRSLQRRIDEMRQSVHTIIARLRPSILDDLGIVPALESLIADFQNRHPQIHFDLAITGLKTRPGLQVETALYRICQEALNNATLHAQPHHVEIRLTACFPDIILMVHDDGRGYDTSRNFAKEEPGQHLGLLGIRERTKTLGGRLTIQSRPGKGTTLRAVFAMEEFRT